MCQGGEKLKKSHCGGGFVLRLLILGKNNTIIVSEYYKYPSANCAAEKFAIPKRNQAVTAQTLFWYAAKMRKGEERCSLKLILRFYAIFMN